MTKIVLKENILLKGQEVFPYFIENKIFALSGPVAKLYRSEIIRSHNITFPKGINMGEDAIFVLRYLNEVSDVAIINQCDYNIRPTEGSLSTRYYSFGSEYACYKEWRFQLVRFFAKWEQCNNPIATAWGNRVEEQFQRTLLSVYRSGLYLSLANQVKCLKTIDAKDFDEYKQYAKPNKWRRKLNWWLICHRWFYTYCFLGKFDWYNGRNRRNIYKRHNTYSHI